MESLNFEKQNMSDVINNKNIFYGIISGFQSVLDLFSGFLDIAFFIKEIKIYFIDTLINLIKSIIKTLKYIVNFEFINNKLVKLINSIILSLGISLIFLILIIIKNQKENDLKLIQEKTKKEIKEFLSLD